MNKFNQKTHSEYIVCNNCSYDANPKDSSKCEICGSPLSSPSEANTAHKQQPKQKFNIKYSLFKKPKFLLPLILLLIAGGGFFFYINQFVIKSTQNQTVSNSQDDRNKQLQKITLLGDTFSGYSTFRNPRFQEKLKEEGLHLNYLNEFDQTKRANLLNQNQADLFVTTLDQFLQQKPQGKIVGMLDRTIGADAIALNTAKYPNLKSLVDLEKLVKQSQKRDQELGLAYAEGTPSEYLALVLDTKFDSFNISDFNLREVADASEAWNLLQDPEENVAVAVLWEPFVTEAEKQGHTVVLSSQDAANSIIDVIVASDRLIASQPDTISQFLAAYYRVIDGNVREPSYLKQQIADDGNLSPLQAMAVLRGIDFFTSIEAKNWMEDGTLVQRINSIAATLVFTGRMRKVPPNPQDLFVSQFVNEAASNTESLISLIRLDNPDLADRLAGEKTTVPVPQISSRQIEQALDIGNLQVKGEVVFNSGSATLSSQSQETLDKLAQEIREFNEQTVGVEVIGHTSKSGSATANIQLSQQRAEVVAQALRARGLKHNIVAQGKGFYLPLSNMSPEDTRQQRTEIRLVRFN